MQYLTVRSSCCWLAFARTAVSLAARVSYDGYKVVRPSAGHDNASTIDEVVANLSLVAWRGRNTAGGTTHVLVPEYQLSAFAGSVAGLHAVTIGQDLGASMRREADFPVYASTGPSLL